MKTKRRPKDPGLDSPALAEKFAKLVDMLDEARTDPTSKAFGPLYVFRPDYRNWFVRRLLEVVARSTAPTREEKIIIALGRLAIQELVRAYLNPCPGLDQSRVTELILGIVDNNYSPPEASPGIITADILHWVSGNNQAAVAELLDRIAKHHVNSPWVEQTPTNGSATPGSTRPTYSSNRDYDILPDEYPEPEEFIDAAF